MTPWGINSSGETPKDKGWGVKPLLLLKQCVYKLDLPGIRLKAKHRYYKGSELRLLHLLQFCYTIMQRSLDTNICMLSS